MKTSLLYYARNPEVEILRIKFEIKESEHELSTVMMRLIGFHPKIKGGREEGIKGQNYTTHGNNFFLYAILYM